MAQVVDTLIETLTNADVGIEAKLFTSTSKNGAFKLSLLDLDSGNYISHMWHKELAPLKAETLKAVR